MGYLDSVIQTVEQGISTGIFPGAVIHLVRDKEVVFHQAFGYAQTDPVARVMNKDAIFDLASLTKVIATLPMVLQSVQRGKLDLHQTIDHYCDAWNFDDDGHNRKGVTIHHLLTHSSGLPAWRPYYLRAASALEYQDLICREPLVCEPGTRVIYSDLGYILLGIILETVWGKPLPEICSELVLEPLGMTHSGYCMPCGQEDFVCTERGNPFEQKMCEDYLGACERGEVPPHGFHVRADDINRVPWRMMPACGLVNDGNAYYGLQGASGHAGLFGTTADVARYLSMWANGGVLEGTGFLDDQLVKQAISNQTSTLDSARGYGFEVAPAAGSPQWQTGCSAGEAASPGGFGHTGFTGTAFWFDPLTQTQAVALTNRTHPHVRDGIVEWRKVFYQSAFLV